MLDFGRFSHLTFDCYGTLIDWESGILAALRPVLARHDRHFTDRELLALYTRYEAELEAGPYQHYRDILRGVMNGISRECGFAPTAAERNAIADSVGRWPPFADTVAALRQLKPRYRLVIISNIDDDLFAQSAQLLGVEFDDVITAQRVGAYKPSPKNFHVALDRIGVPHEQVLHVAQSLYHDHVPAKALGLATVWVNRGSIRAGLGLAPPAQVTPDLVVPDLATLARKMAS